MHGKCIIIIHGKSRWTYKIIYGKSLCTLKSLLKINETCIILIEDKYII